MIRTALLAAATLATSGLLAAPALATTTVPACGNHSLTVSATRENGATGHSNFVLLFKNKTHSSCSLFGYPGLDALNSHGHAIAHAKRTVLGFTGGSHHGLRTIVVKPGHFASADVEWHNFNFRTGGACKFSHSVAATPANTGHTVHLARSVSVCGLQVHPTVAGKSGNG